ncbi:hypothetical protein CKM354_000519100 [Cercospora kikuchii]|uniref:Uncharacterized protein n=1 Tax=Cercospora kikuchii TaxID=84275 RepID=A0A9P3CFQ1_9PEZI|nr:uncharacterized protein CKM354_000519100 [Cercospora kikuchii]GIZ41906.1 hypothetical protein CKM354_000519100 [Cercospora kikuchii]
MSSRRDRERDVRELAQLRIENEALRGQYQMVQDELVRSNAWANHYQAESEQKDGKVSLASDFIMLIKAALIAINELIEQKKQTDEQNFALIMLIKAVLPEINELKQYIEQLEREKLELQMAAVNINK